jgi:outer membrane protein OmpA-like peptidoglycan-associated protein
MTRVAAVALGGVMLLAQGCPSAYQRTYDRETQRLESQAAAQRAEAVAEHAQASRYAAVVYFAVGSATIDEDGKRELRWFVEKIQPYPQAVVLAQGFADSTGTEAKNQQLSVERAQAVAAHLQTQGIAASRIEAQGYGIDSPAASNVTAQGRRNNRRVEVTVR